MAGCLTNEQVEFFGREGYLLFDKPVFPQPKFDALKSKHPLHVSEAELEQAWSAVPDDFKQALKIAHLQKSLTIKETTNDLE